MLSSDCIACNSKTMLCQKIPTPEHATNIRVSLGPSCGLWYFGNLRTQINRVRPAGIDWLGWMCTLTWRCLEIYAIGNWAIDDVNNTVNTSWWKNYANLCAETFFLPIKCWSPSWSWPCSFLTSAGRCAFSQRVVRFGSHLYLYNAVYLSISFVIFLRVSLEAGGGQSLRLKSPRPDLTDFAQWKSERPPNLAESSLLRVF